MATRKGFWSPLRGVILGGLIGLGLAARERGLCEAQATMFFPPRMALDNNLAADSSATPTDEPKFGSEPVEWAQEILVGKDAINALCKRIERTETDRKTEALRSACLLPEDKRVTVVTLPGSFVRLSVWAEDSRVALLLCEGLLAYLTFKTKIPLENPDRDGLTSSEQKLRVQEKALVPGLWSMLAFDSLKKAPPEGAEGLALDIQDYQTLVEEYRQEMRDHFFRETRVAASGPSFVILEPPSVAAQGRPWVTFPLLGVGAGLCAGVLLRPRRKASVSQNVPWRIQERQPSARNAHGDSQEGDGPGQ